MKHLKKLLALLLALTLACGLLPGAFAAAPAAPVEPTAGDVAINAANFPDANFRAFVKQYDTDNNNSLSTAELAAVKTMDCSAKSITTLWGIEYFTALTYLDCSSNRLAGLALSKNTALTWLSCNSNRLAGLDLSKNTALTHLECADNQLTSLDVSKNTALKALWCKNNALTSLDVSKNTALTQLDCSVNQLPSLDVIKNTALTILSCYGNRLTSLDVSAVPALKDAVENGTKNTSYSMWDRYSSSQGDLYVDKTVNIVTNPSGLGIGINAAYFPDANFCEFVKLYDTDSNGYLSTAELAAVKQMNCSSQYIADLKGVEHFTALTHLLCHHNSLTSLDVSKNTALKDLTCYDNRLTTLDLSTVPALKDAVENGIKSYPSSGVKYSSSMGELWMDDDVKVVIKHNPFTDVQDGKYYYAPVLWAYNHDPRITGGTDDTHFSPGKDCTREQIVTFLWKAAGAPEPTSTTNPFTDVKPGKYYYKAVLWAVENNITGGVSADRFGVGQPCKREQAMTFLWKACGSPEPRTSESPFTDVQPGKYYFKPVLWAVENGVTGGVSATLFGVGRTCTRAQIVTFLYKADQLLNIVRDLSLDQYGRLTITVKNGSGMLTYRFERLNQISGEWETAVTRTSEDRTITLESSMGGTFRCIVTDQSGYSIVSRTVHAGYG